MKHNYAIVSFRRNFSQARCTSDQFYNFLGGVTVLVTVLPFYKFLDHTKRSILSMVFLLVPDVVRKKAFDVYKNFICTIAFLVSTTGSLAANSAWNSSAAHHVPPPKIHPFSVRLGLTSSTCSTFAKPTPGYWLLVTHTVPPK